MLLPTKKGVPAGKPLPALFLYTPYLRAFTIYDKNGKSNIAELEALPWHVEAMLRVRSWVAPNGNLMDALFRRRWLEPILKSGYVVVVVERPGTGASFGKYTPDATTAGQAN